MWLIIVILALIAAGIYTGSAGFYVAAAIVGAFMAILMIVVALGALSVKKSVDKQFDRFDKDWFHKF